MREEQPFAFTCSTFEVDVDKTHLRVTFMVSFNASKQHTHPLKKKKKKTKRQLLEDVTFLFSSRSFFFFQLHSLFVFVTCFTSFSLRYLPIGVRCEVVLLFGSSAFAQFFFFFFFPPSLVCSKQTKRRAAEDSCTRSPSQYTNIKSSLTICFLSFLFFFF